MLNLDTNIVIAMLRGTLRSDERAVLDGDAHRAISAIVLWELAKLERAGRIRQGLTAPEMSDFFGEVEILPITVEIARMSQRLDFEADPADEIIAATSLVHRAPLVTRDARMLSSRLLPLAVQ